MALTIRDVAKEAGVSTATVSNVLNKTGKVGRKTHRMVLSAVKRLGYIPDVHARHLASHDRRTLGIIVSDIENPFFPEVIKSFEIRARQLGYNAIMSDTNYDPRRTREAAHGPGLLDARAARRGLPARALRSRSSFPRERPTRGR